MFGLGLFRLPALIVILVLAVIVLGISANLDYGLGIATSVLTLVSVLPVLIIDFLRKGVFTSWAAVELAWIGILWVLWLATGADAAASTCHRICYDYGFGEDCYELTGSICSQIDVIAAFGFINWLLLLAIWIWTLFIGVRAHNRGDTHVWQQPAYEYAPGSGFGTTATPMTARGPMVGSTV